MNEKDIMHNDLFMYGGNLCRFVIRSTDAVVERISDKTTYLPCAVREAEPIPLTPEILKKNDVGKYLSYYFSQDNLMFQCGSRTIRIKHVHELQHLLRLCGLNELADNFKV